MFPQLHLVNVPSPVCLRFKGRHPSFYLSVDNFARERLLESKNVEPCVLRFNDQVIDRVLLSHVLSASRSFIRDAFASENYTKIGAPDAPCVCCKRFSWGINTAYAAKPLTIFLSSPFFFGRTGSI